MTDHQDLSALPCPFCGAESSSSGYQKWSKPQKDTTWEGGDPITEAFFCNCPACGVNNICGGIGHRTRRAAIIHWNRRDTTDHERAVQAAVAKAVDASLKPLVWAEDTSGFYGKGHFDAMFRIGKRATGFHIDTNAGVGATLKTLDAAKAFYQREYAEYVLAAFDTAAIRSRGVAG